MDLESTGPRYVVPYAVTAVCAGAGVVLRLVSGPGALTLAVLVLMLVAGVIAGAHLIGKSIAGVDRGVEVAYVTWVLAVLAGWTAAAGEGSWPVAGFAVASVIGVCAGWAAYGPWKRVIGLSVGAGMVAAIIASAFLGPLGPGGWVRWLVAWWVGTTCAALPFWVHAHVRDVNRPDDVDVTALTAAIGKHARCHVTPVPSSLNVGPQNSYSLRYQLSDGKTAASVQHAIAAVESELGLRPNAVMVEASRHKRNEVTVSVVPVAPEKEARMPDLPTSIVQPAPLGVHDNGKPMRVSIYGDPDGDGKKGASCALFGGEPGSGKSRALWTLMKGWTHCRDVLFVFADMSGGATSKPWQKCLHWVETKPDRFMAMVQALLAEATARSDALGDLGWESWQPSPEHPAIVFIVDEAQIVLMDTADNSGWARRSAVEQLMQVSRKSGISVVNVCPNPVLTQGIGTTARECSGVRGCFKSLGQAVKWVLGDTPAAEVSEVVGHFDKPGQILAYGPGLDPTPGRAFDTDLAEARRVAEAHALFRPDVSGLLTAALRNAGRDGKPGPGPGVASPKPDVESTPAPAGPAVDPALFGQLREMSEGEGPFGRPWPTSPNLPPTGRMSTRQALGVMAGMVQQQGGASPADMAMATGYSRQWVHKTLAQWEKDRLVDNTGRGRWEAVSVAA